jgi:hypothetical protein
MADYVEVAKEIDRLITQGHQDSSLMTAIQRLFPDVTKDEIEAALNGVIADRSLRVKRSQQLLTDRTDDVPEE